MYTLTLFRPPVNKPSILRGYISPLLRFAPGVLAVDRLSSSLPSLHSFRDQAPPDQRAPWDRAIRHVPRQVRRAGAGRSPRTPRQARGGGAPPGDPGGGDPDPDPDPPAKSHRTACISHEVQS